MKRVFAFVLAVMFGWGSVTQPARAFAPVAVLAAPQIVTASGVGYALSAMAGVIGITGLYMTIKDAQDNAVRVPLGPNSQNEPPPPAAPATATTVQVYNVNGKSYSDYSSACDAMIAFQNSQQTVGNWGMGDGINEYSRNGLCTASCTWRRLSDGYTQSCGTINLSVMPTTGCPAGYTMVNSACTLQNSRLSEDDKACDLLVAGGQFATAADRNCSSSVDGSKLQPMLRDGKMIAYGVNQTTGQPLMWEVTPGAQTYTVKEYQQVQTATQTQIKTTTATVDAATSAVTSVQTETSPGSISSPSAGSVPQATTTADPTTATNTPTVTQDSTKPADTLTCGLPGSPACNVNDDGFTGQDTFSGPKTQEVADKLDQNKNQLENIKDSIPTITGDWLPSLMPGEAVYCTPLTFDFSVNNRVLGQLSAPNTTLDICNQLDLVRAILGYMLGVYTVWYVWRRFTTANQGA